MDYLRKRWFSRSNPNIPTEEKKNPYILEALKNLPGTPREFRLKDLEKATNNFNEKMKSGQAELAVVYKGVLGKEKLEVAVKKFKEKQSLHGSDLTELTMIYQLRHRHLLRLLGWCHEHGNLLLVYDYMPNGSLDRHLFSDGDNKPLCWNLRYKIISEVASALHYLHNEFDQRVVHRDIKTKSIMLDSKFNARLGGLGLALTIHKEAEAECIVGTKGYVAPECFDSNFKVTDLMDVYSFGVVLLEVVCGEKVISEKHLPDRVREMYCDGQLLELVDRRLGEDYVVEEAQRILLLGLACTHQNASERPRSQEIVQILSGYMAVPQVLPFKPPFICASRPAEEEDIISLSDRVECNSLSITSDGSGWTPQATNEETQRPYAYTDLSLI